MVIVGAKGFAKEILNLVYVDLKYKESELFFFDNVSNDLPDLVFDKFKIIKSLDEIKILFQKSDNSFVLGLGNPKHRENLFNIFKKIGGKPITTIAKNTVIGIFDVTIGEGTNIMSGAILTNSIRIGKGCLINLNCTIGHDCEIGDFVEISPNSNISGHCIIGNNVTVCTNAVILPKIKLGKNCIIAAGAVVTKNVPENCLVAGVPARIVKQLNDE